MAKVQKISKDLKKSFSSPFKEYWNKYNYFLLGFSLTGLFLGYFLMTRGPWDSFLSLSLSPVVLTVVYLVIIPLTIFFNKSITKTK
jgi:hypothetical protein